MASIPIAHIQGADTVPTGLTQSVGKSLPNALLRVVRELDPEKIILFGSFAYGRPTPDSDVDLLVIMHTDLPPLDRYLRVSGLLDPRPFPVDIQVKTPTEIKEALTTGDVFVQEIVARGLVLYERSN